MHFLTTTEKKRLLMLPVVAMLACVCFAQDKLASIPPIDKRLRAIDSVSLVRLTEKEFVGNPAASLYPEWNNTYTTNFGVQIPKEYKIDIRGFHMPCESRRVTSSYGYRRSFRRNHYGTDIKVYVGDTIRSAFSGKVRIVANNPRGYGKYIVVRHHNGLETVYGHLSKHLVVENQDVKAGEVIGLGGNTGRSTGSHLHFETRFLGQAINPALLFDFEKQDIVTDTYLFKKGNNRYRRSSSKAGVVASNGGAQYYKVRKGDSLSRISQKTGVSIDRLCKLNGITRRTTLRINQVLKCS